MTDEVNFEGNKHETNRAPTLTTKSRTHGMITHQTLYNLANALGVLAMLTVVGYHFVSVNARHLAKKQR